MECLNNMKQIVESAGIGVSILAVRIDSFTLLDKQISEDLAKITRSVLAKKSTRITGELAVEKAEAVKLEAERKADADATVKIKIAEADAKVKETEARALGRAKVAASEAENQVRILIETTKAKADLEVEKINAERRQTKLDIDIKEKIQTAEAEASSIRMIADATFEKETKEFEARSKMPVQELELAKARIASEAVKHFGEAAWRYPDQMSAFMENIFPLLRLGPKTAPEVIATMGDNLEKKK